MPDDLDSGTITRLLRQADAGASEAHDELMRLVYRDLEAIAARHMRREFGPALAGATLEPSALVNEAYLRLIRQKRGFANRGQFFAIVTKVLLRVLIDYQRARSADKRGGGQLRVTLTGLGEEAVEDEPSAEIQSLVTALDELERLDARKARVVKARVLWGMTNNEIAEAFGISVATVERDWSFSRRWLAVRLEDRQPR